jgi:hypothetical protein
MTDARLTAEERETLGRSLGMTHPINPTAPLAAAVEAILTARQAEVANAFFEWGWGMANEVSGVPLDWAWFGEITRRYSPRHEHYDGEVQP